MKRHGFDLVSFVFGMFFIGLGIAALVPNEDVGGRALWVGVPILVIVGLAIIASAVVRLWRHTPD